MREDNDRPVTLGVSVLIIGQGPPAVGGIPSFVTRLLEDRWLRERVRLHHLNTTPPGRKSPGAFTLGNLRQMLRDGWRILRLSREVQVVHLNVAPAPTLPLLRALMLSAAARLGGARVILHAHTGRLETCLRSPVYRACLRLGSRIVDVFVVVSAAAQTALSQRGFQSIRLENGVDPAAFRVGPKAGPPPRLAFVGTVCERKGLIDLRDALVLLRRGGRLPVDVQVAGDGDQEGDGVFERVVAAYKQVGLEEVRFLGRLDRKGVEDLLASASIFCLPSHWEGSPLSLLEAMASGAVPIATAVGEIPNVLDGGDIGLVIPVGEPAALAAAIELLAADPSKLAHHAESARRRIEERYAVEHTIRAIHDLYLEAKRAAGTRSHRTAIRARRRYSI